MGRNTFHGLRGEDNIEIKLLSLHEHRSLYLVLQQSGKLQSPFKSTFLFFINYKIVANIMTLDYFLGVSFPSTTYPEEGR